MKVEDFHQESSWLLIIYQHRKDVTGDRQYLTEKTFPLFTPLWPITRTNKGCYIC